MIPLRALTFLLLLIATPLAAGENTAPAGKSWVQVASHADLEEAVAQAEAFGAEFEFTRVFLADSGWYAVALGIVADAEAERTLAKLKRERRIPRDAMLADGEDYAQEIWSARRARTGESGFVPRIARAIAIERRLEAEDRRAVQVSLIWTGDYAGAVDGLFGAGTRAAIRRFQARSGTEPSGFLAAADLKALRAEASARQEAVGWRVVEDGPMGLVTGFPTSLFGTIEETDIGRRFEGTGPARGAILSLVSLDGGRQTLEDLLAAARSEIGRDPDRREIRGESGFTLAGEAGGRQVWTHAVTDGRAVRGFILSYDSDAAPLLGSLGAALEASLGIRRTAAQPRIEEELGLAEARPDPAPQPRTQRRREEAPQPPRVTSRPGEPGSGGGRIGSVDQRPQPEPNLPRREEVQPGATETPKRPKRRDQSLKVDSTGTGFYVSAEGHILTNHHVVEGCGQMVVDRGDVVSVLAVDREHDLALLSHPKPRTGEGIARFAPGAARLNSDVTVVGYPLYGLLGGLNATRGVVSSLSGLRGDDTFIQISAEVQPGNSGGPVIDAQGYILGVVQSKLNAVKLSELSGDIPQNVNFAIRGEIAQAFLTANGVVPEGGAARDPLAPADLADAAQQFTVLLECYK